MVVDVSGSMMQHLQIAAQEVRAIAETIPEFKTILFAEEAREVSLARFEQLADARTHDRIHEKLGGFTDIASGLGLAAKMDPQTTILISDSQSSGEDSARCRTIALGMTGSIFTFLCGSYDSGNLMKDLARIGRGRRISLDGHPKTFRDAMRTALKDVTPSQTETVMARKQLPDHLLETDQFEFIAPEDEEHDLRKRVKIITGTVFDVEHRAPEWNYHGQAVQQRIGFQENRSVVTKPQGVFRTMLGSLFSPPQVEPLPAGPRESYRGALREAQQPRALPSPQVVPQPGQLALPAPQQAPRAPQSVPALSDQRESPMQTDADRVAAVFRRK